MQTWAADLLAFGTLVLPVILVFGFQESSPHQSTWGKRRLGLRVVTASGGRLTRRRALVRSVAKFLPWQLAHSCVIRLWLGETSHVLIAGAALAQLFVALNLLTMILSRDHSAVHDWLSAAHVTGVQEGQHSPTPLSS